jgi:hypothetical protein
MTSKIAIKEVLQNTTEGAKCRLGHISAGAEVTGQTMVISEKQIYAILSNIGQVILADPHHIPEWFTSLRDEYIFPVASPSKVSLCGRVDHFYIPDSLRSGKLLTCLDPKFQS